MEHASCTIGRSTESTIVVGDLSVPLAHSAFVVGEGGVSLECRDATELVVDGSMVASCLVVPGQQIRIGAIELRVLEATGEEDLALELRVVSSRGDDLVELTKRTRMGVASGLMSRRVFSWALVFLSVGAFLVMPLWVTQEESIWSSGPISSTHSFIAHDCGACHVPFTKVQDDSCLECHSGVGAHFSESLRLTDAADRRCSDCHLEHEGTSGLALVGQESCSSCHAKISGVHPNTTIEDASDFLESHPEFTLALPVEGDLDSGVRVKWSTQLREESGIRFSHFRHVGEPVLEPGAGSRHLRCDECHSPDALGMYMEPISFEDHCQSCHSLAFDSAVSGVQAFHGDPVGLRSQLRGLYSERALKGKEDAADAPAAVRFLRPGRPLKKAESEIVYDWVETRVSRAESVLAGDDGECARCHEVKPGAAADGGFDITPVSVPKVWMPDSIFTHKTHRPFPCRDCHAAAAGYADEGEGKVTRPAWSIENASTYSLWSEEELSERFKLSPSRSSHDVLMPGIADCRPCHGGAESSQPLLASECVLCHPFHRDEHVETRNPNSELTPGVGQAND